MMFSEYDLDDENTKTKMLEHDRAHSFSLGFYPKVEFATVAIFCYQQNKKMPKQIGSGVAVCLCGEYFIFSAAHVFDDFADKPIIVGYFGGLKLIYLQGDRFSTAKLGKNHNSDPIDASVYHIHSELDESFKKIFLNYNDLDLYRATLKVFNNFQDNPYVISGVKSNRSNISNSIANFKQEGFPTREMPKEVYDYYNLNQDIHIAMVYDKKRLVNGKLWETSPNLKGCSGGAIIRSQGIVFKEPFIVNQPKQKLTAILIEHKLGRGKYFDTAVGIRVNIHLGLINKYLPNLKFYSNLFV